MKVAATFLAGAKGRLLPASIPFRFFTAAVVFHLVMWLALCVHPEDVVGFAGGLGPGLAVIHLLTLGVLTTTAIGASVQLLPVATRQPIAALWPIKLAFWLTVPGTAVLTAAMYLARVYLLLAAAVVTVLGLLLFAVLLADNLRRAASLPIVAAYGWAALTALALLTTLGLLLAFDYVSGMLPDHASVAATHVILAGFGFMGMLALGFSHVLVPMFALAAAPPKWAATAGFALACAAIVMGASGALIASPSLIIAALIVGLGAAGFHLWLMRCVLADGMRKRLGLSFAFIRAAWWMLPACLLVGIAHLLGVAGDRGATLFGLLLFGGWLLTFLLGVLQRILPFLASMHTAGIASPRAAEHSAFGTLEIHAVCHGAALVLLATAIVADSAPLARLAGIAGLGGACAFGWFAADIVRRVAAAR